jgi:hypothetical protein
MEEKQTYRFRVGYETEVFPLNQLHPQFFENAVNQDSLKHQKLYRLYLNLTKMGYKYDIPFVPVTIKGRFYLSVWFWMSDLISFWKIPSLFFTLNSAAGKLDRILMDSAYRNQFRPYSEDKF